MQSLMAGFSERTGLSGESAISRRYLWTDAFAVCNFIELYRETGDAEFIQKALTLVDQVHHVLGRFRDDDSRHGWISGLSETDGADHPTCGGLRIGKDLGERTPHDPFDERSEWDRDGQYFHYLTKWMHALDLVARVTGEPRYHQWAVELAKAAHAGFCYTPFPGARHSLHWKMSIDLSYALVPSMGHHDPLDGFITCQQLKAGLAVFGGTDTDFDLENEIAELAGMCADTSWKTMDALGIGGLLTDACRLTQLILFHGLHETELLDSLLRDAESSLGAWARLRSLNYPVSNRLAFRELGLSIGLSAILKMQELTGQHTHALSFHGGLKDTLARISPYTRLRETIEEFWIRPENQESGGWLKHREINTVMLATSLGPEAFLKLDGHPESRREVTFSRPPTAPCRASFETPPSLP